MPNKRPLQFLLIVFFIQQSLYAISRSHGFGIRGGLWSAKEEQFGLSGTTGSINNGPDNVQFSAPGGTASLFFFTRLSDRFFGELTIGVTGNAEVSSNEMYSNHVKSAGLVPFCVGFRYDFFSPHFGKSFHPYAAFGFGYYLIHNSEVTNEYMTNTVVADLDSEPGGYTGLGLFLNMTSRFAFNLEARYHFVGYNSQKDYSGLEFSLGFCYIWGRKQEIFKVESMEMIVNDVYPAYYQFYNTYPLAIMKVRNTVSFPIEVNVQTSIPDIAERTHESGFVTVPPGEVKNIPIFAHFGRRLLNISERVPASIDLEIEARAGTVLTKTISTQIMVHSKNAWNGDIDKLAYFVEPDNPSVRALAREAVIAAEDTMNGQPRNLDIARQVIERLRLEQVMYMNDPNIPFYQDDRVQFAESTLSRKTGDCDDLVVLLASLFESLGIHTAFIDVKDPEKELAHLYLMFDTGLPANQGYLISENEKKYILYENHLGRQTCWIPVETTLIGQGFDKAWNAGAMQFLQEAKIRHGLLQGWVTIVPIN